MTTIATDGKSMAGDRLTHANCYLVADMQKVFRAPSGVIFGASGDAVSCIKFRDFMLKGGDWPELSEDFHALLLNVDGTVDWIDKHRTPVRYAVPAAIGSGCELAIGAMLAGAYPVKAVHIAASRDRCSAGEVDAEHLNALREAS